MDTQIDIEIRNLPLNRLEKLRSSLEFLATESPVVDKEFKDSVEKIGIRYINVFGPVVRNLMYKEQSPVYRVSYHAFLKSRPGMQEVGYVQYTQEEVDEKMVAPINLKEGRNVGSMLTEKQIPSNGSQLRA